jgi:rhamnosyltransferase
MAKNRVYSIVVSYNSNLMHLEKVLSDLVKQCNVVVVDNSTKNCSRTGIRDVCGKLNIHLIALNDNFGIAYGQNVGVAWVRSQGGTEILLLDDDSTPNPNLVSGLLEAQAESGCCSAVIGAITVGPDGKNLSNTRTPTMRGFSVCTELNSSGTLIPISVFDRVGNFNESLFIDCVDFEWGWRARLLGIPLLLCEDVVMQHRLGHSSRFGLRIPSPIRHYYQYRNVLKMVADSGAPAVWRLSQLVKLPIKLVLILFIADRRYDRLRYAVYGIVDFVLRRYGKFCH